jgi:hypothetical protein
VLRPGGRLQIADIVVRELPSNACRAQPQLWAECIVGAVTADDYFDALREARFENARLLGSLDYFAASDSESTRSTAEGFGAHTIVMTATKPA